MASRPSLDAWYGARDWALEHLPAEGGVSTEGWISRQDYEEKGGEYLSEHCASNVFIPIKLAKPVPSRPTEPAGTSLTLTGAFAATTTVTSDPTPLSFGVSDNPVVTS